MDSSRNSCLALVMPYLLLNDCSVGFRVSLPIRGFRVYMPSGCNTEWRNSAVAINFSTAANIDQAALCILCPRSDKQSWLGIVHMMTRITGIAFFLHANAIVRVHPTLFLRAKHGARALCSALAPHGSASSGVEVHAIQSPYQPLAVIQDVACS